MPLNKAINVDASTATFGSYTPSVLGGGVLDLASFTASIRANYIINGGGTITYNTSGYITWGTRFIVISGGRGINGGFGTSGYFDINIPSTGTTVIGVGGAADRLVDTTAGGILLNVWESLYYVLPIGSSATTLSGNFRIAQYTSNFDIPANWVRIATRNGDDNRVYFNNGIILSPGQSSSSSLLYTSNLYVGTSGTENYIAFRGTTGDNPGGYDHGYIGERIYGGTEQSELLIFKGNDNDTTSGLDRIRLLAAGHRFDTYSAPLQGTFSAVGSAASTVRMNIDSSGVSLPKLNFSGGTSTISALTLADGTVSFESTAGQLFSISNSLTGTIFSINDISGLPSVEVTDLGIVKLNELYGQTVIGSATPFSTSSLTVYPRTTTSRALTIKGIASQNSDIFSVQSSADGQYLKVDQSGNVYANPRLFVGTTSYVDAYRLYAVGGVSTEVVSVIRGAASQSADLQQWQNSAGTVISKIDASGNLTAASIIKTSGTSSQFLKADGSVDSTTYASTSSPTISTLLTVVGGALGTTAGNEVIVNSTYATSSNVDYIKTRWRRVSNGTDWQTAQAKIQRTVDVTDMGYIGFGGTSTYDVRIGSATTDIAVFAPTAITLSQPTTANSFIPSSSTVPTNGMYLPAANTVGFSSNSTQRIGIDANGTIKFLSQVAEAATVSATAAATTVTYDVMTNKNVLYYTSNATADWTFNVRGSATVTLNTLMDIGQSLTVVFMNTNGTTAYRATAFQIDGTAVTPKWFGGSAPTAGNASSIDVYTYNIIKTAASTYTVLASLNKFA